MNYIQQLLEDSAGTPIMPVTTDDSIMLPDGTPFKDAYYDKKTIDDKFDEVSTEIEDLNNNKASKDELNTTVRIVAQTLTDEQKAQVQTNIGIVYLTQEAYDQLAVKSPTTLYMIMG